MLPAPLLRSDRRCVCLSISSNGKKQSEDDQNKTLHKTPSQSRGDYLCAGKLIANCKGFEESGTVQIPKSDASVKGLTPVLATLKLGLLWGLFVDVLKGKLN